MYNKWITCFLKILANIRTTKRVDRNQKPNFLLAPKLQVLFAPSNKKFKLKMILVYLMATSPSFPKTISSHKTTLWPISSKDWVRRGWAALSVERMEMDTYTNQELIREHVQLCPSETCGYYHFAVTWRGSQRERGDKEERPFEETIPENLSILMKNINPYI